MRLFPCLFAACTALIAGPAAADSRSITSFAPDTLRAERGAQPPGTVDLLVWSGADVAPYAPYLSAEDAPRQTQDTPWIGVAVDWPVGYWRRWLELGYAHWDLRPDVLVLPFAANSLAERQPRIDELVSRTGIDRLVGFPGRPWAFAGVGAGIGSGRISSRFVSEQSQSLASFEVDARAGLILQVNDRNRVSLFASGGPVYVLSTAELTGTLYRVEVHLTYEARIRIPKRLIPAE